jgi:hypothetical protein
VGYHRAVVSLGWDREHSCDERGVFGVAQGGELVERVDRGEPRVAGADRVVALVLEVVKERADQLGVEIGQVKPLRCDPPVLLGEREQQPHRVAV